jgi:hypothetical protein
MMGRVLSSSTPIPVLYSHFLRSHNQSSFLVFLSSPHTMSDCLRTNLAFDDFPHRGILGDLKVRKADHSLFLMIEVMQALLKATAVQGSLEVYVVLLGHKVELLRMN